MNSPRNPWWQCRKCREFTHVSHFKFKSPRCRCGFTRGRAMTHGQKLIYYERTNGGNS